jgi:NhaP-type Na+/H+ or K+/H+ antiporter
MRVESVTTVVAAILLWCVFAGWLERLGLSMPMVFVAVGLLFTELFKVFDFEVEPELVKVVAEVTLAWVLFSDSSAVKISDIRRDLGSYGRLLGIGLPLTIALGTPIAMLMLGFGIWSALLVAAALSPTDAALGQSVMANPRVPERIRDVLNVESGLNDGLATPIVLLAIAGLGAEEGTRHVHGVAHAAVALLAGAAIGLVVGCGGGLLIRHARAREWLSAELSGPATLALALLAYTVALLLDSNGFVAAFIGGLAFGNTAGRAEKLAVYFVEQSADLASMLSWLIFGAVALPSIKHSLEWQTVGYAVLSLTVIRMIPVAIALLGSDFRPSSVAFIGWFGPRGLASVIFALLALEDLGGAAQEVSAVIGLTVVLSVIVHGVTARPLSRRLAAAEPAPTVSG